MNLYASARAGLFVTQRAPDMLADGFALDDQVTALRAQLDVAQGDLVTVRADLPRFARRWKIPARCPAPAGLLYWRHDDRTVQSADRRRRSRGQSS